MSYTKKQIIVDAFASVGIDDYLFDADPEQLSNALRTLDRMIAGWEMSGITLGYPLPTTPQSSKVQDDSNIPDYAVSTVIMNLGIILANSIGRPILPDIKRQATQAFERLSSYKSTVPTMSLDSRCPAGQGNRLNGYDQRVFVLPSQDTLDTQTQEIEV